MADHATVFEISCNPGCLTDGIPNVPYIPSPGAVSVVIDLGEECSVSAIVPESAVSSVSVEDALRTEVAGDDRIFGQLSQGTMMPDTGIRYIRVADAAGLREISIYGRRPGRDLAQLPDIRRASSDGGWIIPVPELDPGTQVDVRIFDLAGRLVWGGAAEPGTEAYWNGLDGSGSQVPDGLYLVQYSAGSTVRSGRLMVTGE